MMKRIILFMSIILLISSTTFASDPTALPEKFISIVQELENYLLGHGIQVKEGEEVKDVVTFGYLNAINRLNVGFGTFDDRIQEETMAWLSLWCWLPGVPEEKKKKVKPEMENVRKALANGAYKRTLASLMIVPGLAVTTIGEIVPPKELFMEYPQPWKSRYVFEGAVGSPRYTSEDFISNIQREKFDYKDMINTDWVDRYLILRVLK